MMRTYALLLLLLLSLAGCQKDSTPSSTPAPGKEPAPAATVIPPTTKTFPTTPLLAAPTEAVLVESAAEALPTWRKFREGGATLVLLANQPFMQRLPDELAEEATELIVDGDSQEYRGRLTALVADPLVLPDMAVRAAIGAGLFNRVVWVVPAKVGKSEFKLDILREQLLSSGIVDDQEAASLQGGEGRYTGVVAGVPFEAVHPDALPALAGPVMLHLDLSFFQAMYKGEIKTPLYSLMGETLGKLQATRWNMLGVSVSFSNLEGGIPLASRFVGYNLGEVFGKPSLLESWPPAHWQKRGEALYLENFFKKEEIRELYLALEKTAPKDASVKFALYNSARQFKDGKAAMDYLAKAVRLDRTYGLEYLNLADVALEKRLAGKTLEMLGLAAATFPENPFIPLSAARACINFGHPAMAKEFLPRLQMVPWSKTYYAHMPGEVANLLQLTEHAAQ